MLRERNSSGFTCRVASYLYTTCGVLMYDLGSTVYAYFSPMSVTSEAGMQLMVAPRAHGKVELCSRIVTLRMTPFRMVLMASVRQSRVRKANTST